MATTLVAVFDDNAAAQSACDRLAADGLIDRDAVRVTSASAEESGSRQPEHHGGIRGFFASLFGMDDKDESAGHYAEAVRRGSAVLTVDLADDSQAERTTDILEQCGAIDVDERVQRWKADGYTGHDPAAASMSPDEMQRERQKLQVMQEELKVGKRNVSRGGVRVHRSVTETPVEEDVELRREDAVIERQKVDRPASAADMQAFKDADVEIRESAEEPVVSKTARVVEEVSVGKRSSSRTQKIKDTVRRSDVEVERLDEGMAASDDQPVPAALLRPGGGQERRFNTETYLGNDRRAH